MPIMSDDLSEADRFQLLHQTTPASKRQYHLPPYPCDTQFKITDVSG